MRKRLLSILLSVFMIAGMIPLCAAPASAEGETLSEILEFDTGNISPDGSYFCEGENFIITADAADSDGICGGSSEYSLKIKSIGDDVTITAVDAVVSWYGSRYGKVGVSSGTKEQTGTVSNGTLVSVTGVDSNVFAFTDGEDICQFKNVTVCYRVEDHSHDFSVDVAAWGSVHKGKCSICGITGEEEHRYTCVDNGNGTHTRTCSVCSRTETSAHTFDYTAADFGTYTAVCECGAGAEKLTFDETSKRLSGGYLRVGSHFMIESNEIDSDGFCGGSDEYHAKIKASVSNVTITAVDAVVGLSGSSYGSVGVSRGTKLQTGAVANGSTVSVTDINSCAFSFIGGTGVCQFKDVTVYYSVVDHSHHFSVDAVDNGDGTHTCKCCYCNAYGEAEEHSFVLNGTDNGNGTHTVACACGKSVTEAHTIVITDNGDGTHAVGCELCDYVSEIALHEFTDGVCTCGVKSCVEKLAYDLANIQPDGTYRFEGEHFIVSANNNDNQYGLRGGGGNSGHWVKVEAKSADLTITRVDALVSDNASLYDQVGVTRGRKLQETGVWEGATVNVLGIDSNTFAFANGKNYSKFKDITVYYTVETHNHAFSVECTDNGDGTHTGKCSVCGIVGDAVHAAGYKDNGNGTHTAGCPCGYVPYVTEEHTLTYTVNEDGTHTGACVCGYSVTEAHEPSYTDNGNGTHTETCFCGYSVTEAHEPSYTDNGNGTHTGTCACGYEVTEEHSCTESAVDNGNGTHTGVCVCGFAGEKEAHRIVYTVNENGTHTEACFCGYSVTEAHEISYTDNGNGTHTENCKCGLETTKEHVYAENATDNGDGTHSAKCACGAFGEKAPHIFTLTDNGDGATHADVCVCGYSGESRAHEFSFTNKGEKHVASCACGYTVTENHRFFAPFVNNGDGTHTSTCPCGKNQTAGHSFTIFTDNGNGTHRAECVCGYFESQAHELDESGVCICQVADHCEKLIYNTDNIRKGAYRYETDNFIVTSNSTMSGYDFSGMVAGLGNTLAITPKRSDIIITRVDARVVHAEAFFDEVGITRGRKLQTDGIECNSFVTVDEIDSNAFAFTGGTYWSVLSDVIVYYTNAGHTHIYDGDFHDNGNGTHSRKCRFCDSYSVETEEHSFTLLPTDNGFGTHTATCVCGLSAELLHNFEDGVCACGAESCSEKLVFDENCIREDGSYLYEGEHFRIVAGNADNVGIRGGAGAYWLTVEATDPRATISRVDAVTTEWGGYFDRNCGISRGRKFRNPFENGETVSVIGINAVAFSYADGYVDCKFGDITVYYTLADHDHELSDYTDNEDGTHTVECSICGVPGKTEKHSFTGCDDNLDGTHQSTCICGLPKVEVHDFDGGDCPCGAKDCYLKETLVFSPDNIGSDNTYLYEGEHFRVTSDYAYKNNGIYGGYGYSMKIETDDPYLTIARVDAVIKTWGGSYVSVNVSRGRKFQTGEVLTGSTVNVLGIDSDSLAFEGGDDYCAFGDVIVYYTVADHAHDFSTFAVNDDGTHSTKCAFCDTFGVKEEHFFAFAPDDEDNGDGTHTGTCVCGLDGVAVHDFSDGNTCVCGAKTQKETLRFTRSRIYSDDTYSFAGDLFYVSAEYAYYKNGMYGGSDEYPIWITAKDPDVTITRVDAVVSYYGGDYDEVGISRGRKFQTGEVLNGSTVNVIGIDYDSFAFKGGTDCCYFSDITVYYTACDHDFIAADNGDGTHTIECSLCGKRMTEKHSLTLNCTDNGDGTHTGQCDVCDAVTADLHSFKLNCSDNGDGTHSGTCVCGASGTEEHDFGAGGRCACGVEATEETLYFDEDCVLDNYTYQAEGNFFRITGDYADSDYGIYGGSSYPLRIAATRPDLTITRVDAVVNYYGEDYDEVGISRGTKCEEGEVENGSPVTVTDINSNAFSFAGGTDTCYFTDITVYFTIENHDHDFSVDCTSVDDYIHTGACSVCGIIGEEEHVNVAHLEDYGDGTHSYKCVCGRSAAEPHIFKDGVCACGAESLFEELVFDEDNIQSDDSYFFEGEHFRITAEDADYEDGIYGGGSYSIRIEAVSPDVTITRVDAVVSYYGYYYDGVGISSGRKIQTGVVRTGSTVNVLDIDSDSFAFEDGTDSVYFSDITVYYTTESDDHEHSFGAFTDNGNGTYTAVCECGEELTVTASYEYYFVNGQKPVAGGENGTVNKRAYYVDDKGTKVELERGLLEEDLEVTFAQWYLRTAVQFRETEDGGVNVRFVSMLDENLDDYYEAGFTYTVGGADTFDPLITQFGNTSYIADSKTVKAGDFGLGEEYFILRDVDFAKEAVDADLEIAVTPYVLLTDGVTYITGEAVSFKLGDLVKAA